MITWNKININIINYLLHYSVQVQLCTNYVDHLIYISKQFFFKNPISAKTDLLNTFFPFKIPFDQFRTPFALNTLHFFFISPLFMFDIRTLHMCKKRKKRSNAIELYLLLENFFFIPYLTVIKLYRFFCFLGNTLLIFFSICKLFKVKFVLWEKFSRRLRLRKLKFRFGYRGVWN